MGIKKQLATLGITGFVSMLILSFTVRHHYTSPATLVAILPNDSPGKVIPKVVLRLSEEIPQTFSIDPQRQVNSFAHVNHNETVPSTEIHYEYKGRVLHVNDKLKTELISAYFDFRQNRNMIAVLGCHNHLYAKGIKYYCLTKYSDGREESLLQETSQDVLSPPDENSVKNCKSYRFGCTLSASSKSDLPISVALSTSSIYGSPKSDWINILDSRFESYKTGSSPVKELNFGVCYQTPLFDAKNLQKEFIIESIERNRAMGAEWFTFYFRENPAKEVIQVLKQYENEGVLEVINMTLSDFTVYDTRYYGELLTIRDCIYRNMHRVKYLSMTDLDEVIVPKNPAHKNWNDMLKAIDSNNVGAFQFKMVALMVPLDSSTADDFNHTCHDAGRKIATPKFITHTYRTKEFPIKQVSGGVARWKVIVKPKIVDIAGIHSVYGKMEKHNIQYSVPFSEGVLFHYREPPFFSDIDRCSHCVRDNRFKDLTPGLVDEYIRRVCN